MNEDPDRAPDVLGVPLHRLLHAEGCVTCPHGVVLMGEWRAEEGHDPIAHDLVDGSLVVMDCFHHSLEHRVKDLARLCRVAVGQQFHRALQVRKQHPHELPFTFQRTPRGENLLGEMPGRIRDRSGDARTHGLPGEARPALPAEFLGRRVRGPARRARRHQAGAGLPAELQSVGIIVLACRTPQSVALPPPWRWANGSRRWPRRQSGRRPVIRMRTRLRFHNSAGHTAGVPPDPAPRPARSSSPRAGG